MDCHYVTECLVKPWEWQPGSLRYFDFPSSTLRRGFTSKLFSKPNTNSRRIEVLLNKCIEAPLARFRDIATKPPVTQTKLDWPTQRALHLYFLAQAQRFNKAKRGGQELDQLIQKKESDLDKLVSIMLDDVQIVSLSTAAGNHLLFPELGKFVFPVSDSGCVTGFTNAFAVPLSPTMCLALVSATATECQILEATKSIHAFSIGLNAERVLIPRVILENSNLQTLREKLKQCRELTIEIMKSVKAVRERSLKAYTDSGLEIEFQGHSWANRGTVVN